MSTRAAIGYMTYPGDVTTGIADDIESGRAMGPNYFGEHMWPVEAAFDPDMNVTRVGFSLLLRAIDPARIPEQRDGSGS